MGRPKHRPGRAGTWLEVKVRNRQRYLYERTRVYQGGKSHSPAGISTSCRQRSRSLSKNRRPQLKHRNRDHTDYARQPKQIPRAAAGGEETVRVAELV